VCLYLVSVDWGGLQIPDFPQPALPTEVCNYEPTDTLAMICNLCAGEEFAGLTGQSGASF
jgi:hypothetical protein